MKKHLIRIGAVALCITLAMTMLAACGNKAHVIGKTHVDFMVHNGETGEDAEYVAIPAADITEKKGVITVKVAKDYDLANKLVELDFKKHFTHDKHKESWGKDLTFKRSDRTYPFTIGTGTSARTYNEGYAWEAKRSGSTVTWERVGVTPVVSEPSMSSAIMLAKGEDGKILNYIGTANTDIKYTIKGHNKKDYHLTVRVEKKTA